MKLFIEMVQGSNFTLIEKLVKLRPQTRTNNINYININNIMTNNITDFPLFIKYLYISSRSTGTNVTRYISYISSWTSLLVFSYTQETSHSKSLTRVALGVVLCGCEYKNTFFFINILLSFWKTYFYAPLKEHTLFKNRRSYLDWTTVYGYCMK